MKICTIIKDGFDRYHVWDHDKIEYTGYGEESLDDAKRIAKLQSYKKACFKGKIVKC